MDEKKSLRLTFDFSNPTEKQAYTILKSKKRGMSLYVVQLIDSVVKRENAANVLLAQKTDMLQRILGLSSEQAMQILIEHPNINPLPYTLTMPMAATGVTDGSYMASPPKAYGTISSEKPSSQSNILPETKELAEKEDLSQEDIADAAKGIEDFMQSMFTDDSD